MSIIVQQEPGRWSETVHQDDPLNDRHRNDGHNQDWDQDESRISIDADGINVIDFTSEKSEEESEDDGNNNTKTIDDTGSDGDKIKSALESLTISASSDKVGEIAAGSQGKDEGGINPERSVKIGSVIQSFKESVFSGVNSA